jgi:tetratricopeptide (TPR) repeat protein
MTQSTLSRAARSARPLAAGLVLAALAGCAAGHGKYTGEFLDEAQARMSGVKAATEWDMARQQFLAGDLKKAIRTIDQSIALNDRIPKSHVLRARILIEMHQLEQALGSLEVAAALDPEHAEAHYYTGIVYERFTRYERALEGYTLAFEANPTEPQYLLAAAEMLIQLGRVDDAEAMLTDRTRSFEHNPGIRQTLGHIELMRGDPSSAVIYFEEARLLAADDPALIEDLARAQIEAGEFAEADHNLSRLLERSDYAGRRDLIHLRTRCLIELDRPVEARSMLRELTATERGANDQRAWIELANVSLVLGDYRQLRACATRLLAVAPDRPEGYLAMAMCQRREGRTDAALRSLERAVAVSDAGPDAAVLQAALLLTEGRQEEAARALEVTLAADPADERARRLMGLARGDGSLVATVPVSDED